MNRPRFAPFLAIFLAVGALAGPTGRERPVPKPLRIPPPEEREEVRAREGGIRLSRVAGSQALLSPDAVVDVERYNIDLEVSLSPDRVDGSVLLRARSLVSGLTDLEVDLWDDLTVSSVTIGALPLAFTHSNDLLSVTLDRPYALDEVFDLVVTYGGLPDPNAGFGPAFAFRSHAGQPLVYSLSEPTYAPLWWPCIDHPSDKAIVEMDLTVPGNLVGVSNGVLIGTLDNMDGTKTYQWRSAYPISTYLVSVAITNFVVIDDVYEPVSGGPDMPVQHWVYPEKLTAATQDFSVTVPQLEFFSGLFGEYPFVDEKYGHALFAFGGAMEHQTVSSYGSFKITGDNRNDWIVAHELAHQWWGDSVTLADWPEIWLNEGFASYSEALWTEHLGGAAALEAYVASFDTRPFCGALYDPEPLCPLFGKTVYDKGAFVLHMLRKVVGEADFFQGLRDYASGFAHSNAGTPDFQATMEAASGMALGGFFDRWVYQSGEPSYLWGWSAASTPSGWVTYVHIDQTQGGDPFVMPIDLRVAAMSGNTDFTVQNTQPSQDFALPPLPEQPTAVSLDPDLWILKTATMTSLPDADTDGVPDTADNCSMVANPAQEDLDSDGLGDSCDPDRDGDGRENATDCAPDDATAQDPPGEATGLEVTGSTTASFSWDPDPGGFVTFELLRGDVADLVLDGGVDSAACLLTGLTMPVAQDTGTPGLDGAFHYLVRKRNVCDAGSLGTTSAGVPRTTSVCP